MSDETRCNPSLTFSENDVPGLVRAQGEKCVRAYRGFLEDAKWTPGTSRVYGRHLRRFFRWAESEGLTMETIDAGHWTAYAAALSPNAAGNVLSVLRACSTHMVAAGALTANRFPPPRRPGRQWVYNCVTHPVIPLAELREIVHGLDHWEEDSEFFQDGLVVLAPLAFKTMTPGIRKMIGTYQIFALIRL